MKLCDLHCHSSGISGCCVIPYNVVIDEAKSAGFDAIVLTNHYSEDYALEFGIAPWLDRYIEEHRLAAEYGSKLGIKVFFGVEVTMNFDKRVHMLVYGITAQQLRDNVELYKLSLAELSAFCRKNDLTLVQAHPFRNGTTVLDVSCLDGIEINCHPKYGNTYSAEIIKIAQANGLSVTCGCDYHGDVPYRPQGGIFIPDSVQTDIDLAHYIRDEKHFKLKIHELYADAPYLQDVHINK